MTATYIPVTLEQLASERGVLFSDLITPCRPSTDQSLLRRFAEGDRCVFKLFGLWWVDTASFALYVFSLSVLLQALVVISMSGAADHGTQFPKRRLNSRESSQESVVDFCIDRKCCVYVVCRSAQRRRNVGWSSCHYRKCSPPFPLEQS